MTRRAKPTPASASERSRASRLRARRAAGGRLTREQSNWLRAYEADRRALASARARPRARTKSERDRAYRLRRAKRSGRELSPEDAAWLRRYDGATKLRPKRPPSARAESLAIARAVVTWLESESDERAEAVVIDSRWQRRSRPGKPGIAITDITWGLPLPIPQLDTLRDLARLPAPSGRLANLRVRIGPPDTWHSVIALTRDRFSMPEELILALDRLDKRPSVQAKQLREDDESDTGITGVSVMVAP